MQIEKSNNNGVTTLTVSGEVDLHASPKLREELQACVSEKTPVLLVDFTGVDYIDSSGLATFIEYLRDASAQGRSPLWIEEEGSHDFRSRCGSTSSLLSQTPRYAAVAALVAK
jgi:anti-anti-sigma factor